MDAIIFVVVLSLTVLAVSFILVKTGLSGHVLRMLGYDTKCPFCGSEDIRESQIFAGTKKTSSGQSQDVYTLKYDCSSCGKHWEKEHNGNGGMIYRYISYFDKKNIKRNSKRVF